MVAMLSLPGTLGGLRLPHAFSSPRLSPPGGAIGLDGRLRRYRRFHKMEKASGGQQRACVWCASSSSSSSSEPAEPAELFRRGWVAMPGAASEPTVVIMDSPECLIGAYWLGC